MGAHASAQMPTTGMSVLGRCAWQKPICSPIERVSPSKMKVNVVSKRYPAAGNEHGTRVREKRDNEPDFGDPRPSGGVLVPDQPKPEDGQRLVKALLAIKDAKLRRALIDIAEALARKQL